MKRPDHLKDEARDEAYEYFDKNIRPLPKTKSGEIDIEAQGLQDNDVDAFRHAYVSGVFTQEYSETAADILGRMNEYFTADLYSNSRDPRALNMDLWNNAVGRKYGNKTRSRKELLKKIHQGLDNGELITDLKDKRQYSGVKGDPINASKPVIVLVESKTGRNELFFDTVKREVLTADSFVALIQAGEYAGYTVKKIKGVLTPVSTPDGRRKNNLS